MLKNAEVTAKASKRGKSRNSNLVARTQKDLMDKPSLPLLEKKMRMSKADLIQRSKW